MTIIEFVARLSAEQVEQMSTVEWERGEITTGHVTSAIAEAIEAVRAVDKARNGVAAPKKRGRPTNAERKAKEAGNGAA